MAHPPHEQSSTANPICTHCHQAIATDADHITPISAGGAPYDPLNLQALCAPCHGKKTKSEQQA
jgi:5-methylcytosine-specific restriction protein A